MSNSGAIKAGRAYVEVYADTDEEKKKLDEAEKDFNAFGAAVEATTAGASYASQAGWLAIALAAKKSAKDQSNSYGIVGQAAAAVGSKVAVAFDTVTSAVVHPIQAASSTLTAWGDAISSFGSKVFAAGAGAKAFFAGALATFTEYGSQIAQMSIRTKVGAEALTTLGYAARLSGSSSESLQSGFANLAETLAGASASALEGQRALGLLGLSIDELKQLSPDAQIRLIADRLSRVSDPAQRAAGALMIFGSAAQGLMPLLEQGGERIRGLEEQARSLGLEMGSDDANAALTLKQSLTTLWDSVKMLTFSIGQPLAEAMTNLVQMASKVVGRITQWIKQHKDLIISANTVASVITGAGTAITVFGGILSGAGAVLGYVAATIGVLLSPIAVVTAAIGGLGYYLATTTAQGKAAVSTLMGVFGEMKSSAMNTFGAIAAALKAGDIFLAIEIATSELKLRWAQATQYISEKWEATKDVVVPILMVLQAEATAAWAEISAKAVEAWDTISAKAVAFAESVKQTWAEVKDIWREAMLNLEQYWDRIKPIVNAAATASKTVAQILFPAATSTVTAGKGIATSGGHLAGVALGAAGDKISDTAGGLWSDFKAGVKSLIPKNVSVPGDGLLDMLGGAASAAYKNFQDKIEAARQAREAGKQAPGEDPYGVEAARKAAEEAIARAKALRENELPGKKPGGDGVNFGAGEGGIDFTAAGKAAGEAKRRETPGIGYADARSAEGFKLIAAAVRQGRNDPQVAAAQSLKAIAADTAKNQRWLKQIRDDIHSQQGFNI